MTQIDAVSTTSSTPLWDEWDPPITVASRCDEVGPAIAPAPERSDRWMATSIFGDPATKSLSSGEKILILIGLVIVVYGALGSIVSSASQQGITGGIDPFDISGRHFAGQDILMI